MLHHRRATVVASALAIFTTLVAAPRPSAAESPVDALAKVGAWIQPFETSSARRSEGARERRRSPCCH